MKNKINLKKTLVKILITIIIFLISITIINIYEYYTYTSNYNSKLNSIIQTVYEEYPNISKNALIKILNSSKQDNSFIEEYGISKNESIIKDNDKLLKKYLIVNSVLILFFSILITLIFLKYNKRKDHELNNITKYIEEINHKNYKLDIDENSEDELSILKNEIYKTTVMLNEQAENSLKDKINIKKYLQDISHQLKTPLTSINILLDNLIDNPNMPKDTRDDFIMEIKREITNINFLVQNILRLSKFEANTIDFIEKETSIKEIINTSVKNVSNLCDLKNIELIINNKCKNKITCDFKWQVEALTNILKNAVEYSPNNSNVLVECSDNNLYSEIRIKDFGKGMSKEEQKNIFKRFYKGKNSSKDSIGIGLSLAKTIIEKDNGRVVVESKEEMGTIFIIKYFYSKTE